MGIYAEGLTVDLALEHNLGQKYYGSFFSYGELRIGQGRNNTSRVPGRETPELEPQGDRERKKGDMKKMRDREDTGKNGAGGDRKVGRQRKKRGGPSGDTERKARIGPGRDSGPCQRASRWRWRRSPCAATTAGSPPGSASRLAPTRSRDADRRLSAGGALDDEPLCDRGSPPTSASCAAGDGKRIGRGACATAGSIGPLIEAASASDGHGEQLSRAVIDRCRGRDEAS